MIYCFNNYLSWANSGVEHAQCHRAHALRNRNIPAKFVFTKMDPQEHFEHYTKELGFEDDEVLWIYTYFAGIKTSPVIMKLQEVEKSFETREYTKTRTGNRVTYHFEGEKNYYNAFMVNENSDCVHRMEYIENGRVIRKDYFTYCKTYTEYYTYREEKPVLFMRRFFHEDGSMAYEEYVEYEDSYYRFPDKIVYSKQELIGYMLKKLNLTEADWIIIDRSMDMGQVILENSGLAKIAYVFHAEHYVKGSTNDEKILWNNYNEYMINHSERIDYYITSTEEQKEQLQEHFKKYLGLEPKIVAIPVGSIDYIIEPKEERRRHTLITASRLAKEKHLDELVEAVAMARSEIGDLALDIYGEGSQRSLIEKKIEECGAQDYIQLKGHCLKLEEVYMKYEAYASSSAGEGFGISLLEAIASGLPIVGYDVPYGNRTFVRDGENGYLAPCKDDMSRQDRIKRLAWAIIKLFKNDNLEEFHKKSYEIAENFLTEEVEKKWEMLINQKI